MTGRFVFVSKGGLVNQMIVRKFCTEMRRWVDTAGAGSAGQLSQYEISLNIAHIKEWHKYQM
jgi:hypothetical protein